MITIQKAQSLVERRNAPPGKDMTGHMLPSLQPRENSRLSVKEIQRLVFALFSQVPVRLLVLAALVLLVAQSSGGAAAAQELICLSPAVPLLDLPREVLADYRGEISGEFEAYFAAVTEYIACLDGERARVMAEARDAAAAYSGFLNLPYVKEDIR
ncbi:MAG: hypothetical protein QM644_04975 [Mobilitalea sp.]